MALDVAKALKAIVCKDRRDSYVDYQANTIPPPNLEEMDWLSGPEGEEWLAKLRVVSADDGDLSSAVKSEKADQPTVASVNDENQPFDANVDRLQAMQMATKAAGAPKFTPLTAPPPAEPLGPPPQRPVSFGRIVSFTSQHSSIPVPLSFASRSVAPDGSFHQAAQVATSATAVSTSTPRRRPAPQMYRSLSRGPPVEAKTSRLPDAAAARSSSRIRSESSFGRLAPGPSREGGTPRGNAVARAPSQPNTVFWTPPPEAAQACTASCSSASFVAQPPVQQIASGQKPPMAPVAAVVRVGSFRGPPRTSSFQQPTVSRVGSFQESVVVATAAVRSSSFQRPAEASTAARANSFQPPVMAAGYPAPQTSVPGTPRPQAPASFPPVNSFPMPPRMPSIGFMPSPRELS